MKLLIVQTTCNNQKEAKKIAKILLEKKLAACIQIKEVDSFYIWQDEFCEDKEYLLSIKTKKSNFKKIESKIKELHSYDLPEIIGVDICEASKEYENFVTQNCKLKAKK